MTGFFACFGLLQTFMGFFIGTMIKHAPHTPAKGAPPEFVGWLFGAVGISITLLFGTFAALKLRVARCLRLRTSPGFCKAVAIVSCLEIPYGTVLGVLSFIALSRPSVRSEFERSNPDPLD
jgi:hypothetical protein